MLLLFQYILEIINLIILEIGVKNIINNEDLNIHQRYKDGYLYYLDSSINYLDNVLSHRKKNGLKGSVWKKRE